MKQLDFDKAFPQTPDCIHAAIEMGFRKGQKKMKMQNKIIMLGSIAAALAIMFAAALATGGLNLAPQPDVLAQPPVTDVPKVKEEAMVWCTEKGNYYHSEQHCSGMEGAIYGTLSYALAMDKGPCPVCIDTNATVLMPSAAPASEEYTAEHESATDSMPAAEEYVPVNAEEKASQAGTGIVYVEYGADGNSYHRLQNCGGREYLREITESQAKKENFPPCPACYSGYVFYTEGGKYYHSNEHCQGMMNAKTYTREDARKNHKLPCPLCLLVYAREGGSFFHLLPDCMGMQYADLYTQDEAYAMGNQRCPLCLSPETVYATKLGNYFHAVQDCSGMEGAGATTPETEWANGKLPCPVCIAVNVYENEEAIVYAAYGEPRYYHKTSVCNGQENKRELTLAQADKENLDPCPDCYITAESAASMNESATSMADIDANLSFLGTITQLDRLYQAAFGNLEEVLAAAYGFTPEIAENSWILSNGQQTILSLNFQDTGSDSTLEAKWILNVSLNTDREISNRFMESIRTFPMTAMYPMAIDAAKNHTKEIHPENAEALDPYVCAIRLGIDEEYQVKNCRIQFPCAMHALYVEYLPEEREDGGWSWNEKTYTETT